MRNTPSYARQKQVKNERYTHDSTVSRQAGFNGGDGLRYFNIPGSGTQQVLDLSRQSNVGDRGRWLYRIDSKAGDCDHNGRSFS